MKAIKPEFSSVRIIGGELRGRKVPFCALPDVRPSPDRVRETLFNWLAPSIRGKAVLDLFAGTGVLGFEAMSRGAKSVTFVDRDPNIAHSLKAVTEEFKLDAVEIITKHARDFLLDKKKQYDVVFLDPPYREKALLLECLRLFQESGTLKQDAVVYIETDAELVEEIVAPNYHYIQNKQAGNVYYGLLKPSE